MRARAALTACVIALLVSFSAAATEPKIATVEFGVAEQQAVGIAT